MLFVHQYSNGFVLLCDMVSFAGSVSYVLSVPYGSVFDPVGLEGLSTLLCEMISRGAGGRGSREFLEAFEYLGCESYESVGLFDIFFSVSTLPEHLFSALALTADQVFRPHFEGNYLELVKRGVIQEIYSLEDEPSRRMLMELRCNFLPYPYGRSGLGTVETIRAVNLSDIWRGHNLFQPSGAILSIAGKFNFEEVRDKVGELFSGWRSNELVLPVCGGVGNREVYIDSNSDSGQTHIGVVYPSVPVGGAGYKLALGSVGILSGGSSCRLFRELREKRGLCYSVSATYSALRNRAAVWCYCGTSAEKAQETLDVLMDELNNLSNGVSQEEVERYKIGCRSELIIGRESMSERCGDMLFDWQHLKRIQSFEELETSINSITQSDINNFLKNNPPGPYHVAVLGPKRLKFRG
jgi:predicted Zn-dependent peptidase